MISLIDWKVNETFARDPKLLRNHLFYTIYTLFLWW